MLTPPAIGIAAGCAVSVASFVQFGAGLAAGGALWGLGAWMLAFGRQRRRLAADYLARMHDHQSGRIGDSVAALREDLTAMSFQPGIEQLESLRDRHAEFVAMLRRKLNPAELTYARYLGMSEQVFLAGLDNLARIVDTLDGLSAIDVALIGRRLRHLEDDGIESPAQDAEIRALKDRLTLLQARQARVNELLAENETALTRLAHAMAAIADMDTRQPRAELNMETAMRELQVLIERAPEYSRQ